MRYFLILFFLASSFQLEAKFEVNDNMKNAYSYIINLDIENAKNLLSKERQINPNNGIVDLYENYIDFLHLLTSGEDEVLFQELNKNKLKRIRNIKRNDNISPYYLYSQAEIHLQWAFTRIKFGEYVTGAYEIQKAYFLLKKNERIFPNFYLNNKNLAVLYALIGSIPKQYQWLTGLIGMEGDIHKGLSELNNFFYLTQTDPEYEQYNIETILLLSFLQMNISNENKDYEELLSTIHDKYKTNKLLKLCAARLAHKLGDNKLSLQILNHIPPEDKTLPIYYFDYLLGMSELYNLNYEIASRYFKRFLQNSRGRKHYIKSSYHKLALISFLLGNDQSMSHYFNLILLNGDIFIDEDKKAQLDAERKKIYHQSLLKSQLLYDGGYYKQSLLELEKSSKSLFNQNDISEYWYRKGRIAQRMHEPPSKIIEYFSQSYNKGQGLKAYFPPMSSLQIGYEYEKLGNISKARAFYKKCLLFSNFDYERGIHQKAKVALTRLNR
ncbi:MAG: hypothetical protein VX347_03405 [Bacteroidota bacterium]|nr:hypothetical protein [Bacteroidota bacterium]